MLRWLRDISLIFTLLLCAASGSWAASSRAEGLSGSLAIGAGSYRADVDGEEADLASHLYQQYSVMYRQGKSLYSGRAGAYTLMIGYEHTRLNPSLAHAGVDDPDADAMTRNKLFYQGDLTVAPGGLPFRLHLFAEDLKRSGFNPAPLQSLPLGVDGNHHGHLFEPNTFSDISNGTHSAFGGTLLLGIRNGSYLGSYRDLLSQLPRLLIDFRQDDVADTSSRFSPSKYRQRDLAFISLNKKDNWVHYRVHDFTDYLDARNNTKETQVLIGTIDHTRKREWINLTNWIRFSSDLSYTANKPAAVEIPTRTYAFNLFAIAQRSDLQTSILSSYRRVMDRSGILQAIDLPIQTTYEMNRNTRIITRLALFAEDNSLYKEIGIPNNEIDNSRNTDLFFDTRADMNRTGRLIYRPHLQAERKTQSGAGGSTSLKLGGEVSTNSALSRANAWLLGLDLATVQGENSGNFSQVDLYGRIDREPGRNWRFGSRANLSYGTGQANAGSNDMRIPVLIEGGDAYDPIADDFNGSILQTDLSFYGEHRSAQWGNRLELSHARRGQTGGESQNQASVEHSLLHEGRESRFKWETAVEYDDRGSSENFGGDYLLTSSTGRMSKRLWHSKVSYERTPNRQLEMNVTGGVKGTTDSTFYFMTQKLGYTMYTSNGVVRRIATCDEELSYEGLAKGEGVLDRTGATRLKLSAGIFPTHSYYLLGTAEYVLLQPSSSTIYVLTANTGFNYQLFKINLSYSLGNKSKESELHPDVTEERWSVDVKKSF